MTTTHLSSPEGSKSINLPLFLTTLPRTKKSPEIFRLPALCHIAIMIEAYRAKNDLTQSHNCQQIGQVWANCKQPPRCLWCECHHLYKERPEKGNTSFTPTYCNCGLTEGENPIPPIIGAADT
jgi:hypothetical protein